MKNKRDITDCLESTESDLWSCHEDDGCISADDPFEALSCYLRDASLDRLPEFVTVYGFKREKVDIRDAGSPLEDLLERLDDEYAHEDSTTPTDSMRLAEQVFIAAVLAEYVVWRCDCIETFRVNWREWAAKEEPELLEDLA